MYKVAIVGAGIIGITNALLLLENGFDVIIYTKDKLLETNSDAAVATWYTPGDNKPILRQCCLESLPKFFELIREEAKDAGIQKIPLILYFKEKEKFEKSVWAEETLRGLVSLTIPFAEEIKIPGFPFTVLVHVPLMDPTFYRPYLLNKFKILGGRFKMEKVSSLTQLTESYDVVINSAGWEAKFFAQDPLVYPIRGQTETIAITSALKDTYSLNIEDMGAYLIFRPLSKDCVIGTMSQVNDSDRKVREDDKKVIIERFSKLIPEINGIESTSKVGIRCGRPDARIDTEEVYGVRDRKVLIVHCYGHGGTGFSASWGSAFKVLEYCKAFTLNREPAFKPCI